MKRSLLALALLASTAVQAAPVIIMSRPYIAPPRPYIAPSRPVTVNPVKVYTKPAQAVRVKPVDEPAARVQPWVMPVIYQGQYCTPEERKPGGRCNKEGRK